MLIPLFYGKQVKQGFALLVDVHVGGKEGVNGICKTDNRFVLVIILNDVHFQVGVQGDLSIGRFLQI